MEEIWKDVEGYRGYYQISSHGRFRSRMPLGGWAFRSQKRKWTILSAPVNTVGYRTVQMVKPWLGSRVVEWGMLHRLVANAFIGKIRTRMTVNHKDGNKLNNNLSNLEILSQAQNNEHAKISGLCNAYGESHYLAKLSEDQVMYIRAADCKKRGSVVALARKFSVSHATINHIRNNTVWKRMRTPQEKR